MKNKIIKKTESGFVLPEQKKDDHYSTMPSGQVLNNFKKVITSGNKKRTPGGNKDTKITIRKDEYTKKKSFNIKSRNTDITITVEKYEEIASQQNKNTVKILNFILQKSNEQNHNKEICFDLKELVDKKMYKSIRTAKHGFIKCFDEISGIQVGGTIRQGKTDIRTAKGNLFYHRDIKSSFVTISRNEKINIKFIAQYITLLPKWSYQLKEKAHNLIDYIFYRARQEIKKIKENDYFTMSIKTVCDRLGLPTPEETTKHSEKIIYPLLDAITEIEETQLKEKTTKIMITPVYEEGSVYQFLEGYLKIELLDDSKIYFLEQAIKFEKKIKSRK